jgi:hypothetical protein
MNNAIAVILALILVLGITQFNKIQRRRSLGSIVYRQSYIHSLIKDYIPKNIYKKPRTVSQSMKHTEKHMIKIIVIDGKAYWVSDNIFYTAQTENGQIIHDTAKPVDINNMPKKELDKMLFILDNLGRGDKDDSSGSRNE